MKQSEFVAFIEQLENVQQSENFGYTFFFVGDDHRLPFVTITDSDNEYDAVSNLNRDGVFRLNIGINKTTFNTLITDSSSEHIDYSVLNVFLPHPDYAKQHFVCILNPTQGNIETTKDLIMEAHSKATNRLQRKTSN